MTPIGDSAGILKLLRPGGHWASNGEPCTSIKLILTGPFGISKSDAELSPFIFLLICHESKQPIDI